MDSVHGDDGHFGPEPSTLLSAEEPPSPLLTRKARVLSLALFTAFALYAILAWSLARTKTPWCDEGVFANAAYNLAFHGYMGANVEEPSGHFLNAYLSGIHERTYLVVPNHLVALAGWFRVFGFSLLTMRAYSICCGAITLVVTFYLLTRFFSDRRVVVLGTLFLAIDFVFLWTGADGRMEAPANALALCSLAVYLHFREHSLQKAVLISQIFGAAAVFTHPNALVVLLAVVVLAWRRDRNRFRRADVLLAAVPYVVFAALWSLYILQSPSDFKAQFFANAAGRDSQRWKVIVQPWLAMWYEILRHGGVYMVGGLWSGGISQWMVFIPGFYLAALGWLARNRRRLQGPARELGACVLTVAAGLTFLNGFKAPPYFLYIIPFYDAALAAWCVSLWNRGRDARVMAVVIIAVFTGLQLSTSIQHIRADEYHRDFEPAVAALRVDRAERKTIMATAAVGFGLGFQGFADDWRLGIYDGLRPDVLVLDRSYREFARRFEQKEPAVFTHIMMTLTSDYRLTKRCGSFWIFERQLPDARRPWLDIRSVALKKPGERADYLFEMLLSSNNVQARQGDPVADHSTF